ncbi:prepilin-type N-terminal cleavage/methylation domain-containing protein [Limnohabitans sp.]|uniref:type II secretion system protein n=1 Tax=Limnohabitans sp. TaxID=1907725 RepID=UPI00286F302E|nr:prepilin-type N-terminal cleavage/methylation domain-containing protein [Limnohabitans sp.]
MRYFSSTQAIRKLQQGFTLIELLVVLAIIGTLLSLALPRYNGSVDKTKEAVLRQNVATLRDAIDKFHGDTGKYPQSLDDLVDKQYLRRIPLDPVTNSEKTWVVVPSMDADEQGIADVKSGASGKSRTGQLFQDW